MLYAAAYFVAVAYFPYIGGLGLYFIALISNHATRRAIRNLKAKAMKVDPKTITEPENKDITTE